VDLTSTIRQIFRQAAPDFAVDHFRTLRGALNEVTFNQRLSLYLTGAFAGVAILMVLTGLYGVLSQLVGKRRREIGIRMALGAAFGNFFWPISGGLIWPTLGRCRLGKAVA
jgi:ABC-type antimicrobial peptide transport system permease subunit